MTILTLHFDAPPDADGTALARELQALCAKLDDVEEVQSFVTSRASMVHWSSRTFWWRCKSAPDCSERGR